MKRNSIILASAILSLGIIVLGILLNCGINTFANKDRYVTVKGLSEKTVAANQVIWPLQCKDVGNDVTQLYNAVAQKGKIIVDFLKAGGITDEEISLSAPVLYDREAERYSSNDIKQRYQISSVITVTSSQVDKVRGLMEKQGELLERGVAIAGGDYEYQVQYLFNGLNEIKPQMIEEATRNAREVAEKFAADSDCKIGGIRHANQGQFSIDDRDAYTPYIKRVRVVTTVEYSLK